MAVTESISGLGTSETHKIFSATQVFFHATSHRRALSVEPGISHYASESEHYQTPPPPPPPSLAETQRAVTAPAPVHVSDETRQRGRMRVRRRSSADHLVFQRDPVAHHNRPIASSPLSSFPPTTEEGGAAYTPTSSHFVPTPTSSSSSSPIDTPAPARTQSPPPPFAAPPLTMKPFFTDTQSRRFLDQSRTSSLSEIATPSRSSSRRSRNTPTPPGAETPTVKCHRSHTSLSFVGSIFGRGSQSDSPVRDESRPESPQSTCRERGREKHSSKRHSFFSHHALGKVGEAFGLEEEHKEVGDGWQEFRKGPWLISGLGLPFLTRKDRNVYVPNLFRDSVTHADVFGL